MRDLSNLFVNGTGELELSAQNSGAQVKVGVDNGENLSVGLGSRAVSVEVDRQRLGNSNCVGHLHQHALGQTSLDQRLGDPTGGVGARAIDLGGVLSGEGTSSVSSPTSVRVHNDLASSQTGISLRSSNHKAARGVQVVNGVLVQQVVRNGGLDDLLHQLVADELVGDSVSVLSRNHDSVNAKRNHASIVVLVVDGDLKKKGGKLSISINK